jgi:hypothetical protein
MIAKIKWNAYNAEKTNTADKDKNLLMFTLYCLLFTLRSEDV